MNLSDVDLLKLQTRYMQNDQDVRGFAAALNNQIRKLAGEVNKILIYGNINDQPEEVLDILAWQFNVAWYDANASIEVKRQAINDALIVARTLGTPAAVEKVVQIYFGDGFVEEWWEYGGQPYHFRIVTNNEDATNAQAALLIKTVNAVKRKTAVLDTVIIQSTESMNLYHGLVLQMTDKLLLKQVV